MKTVSKSIFRITLVMKDLSSQPATIETDGRLPEVICARTGKFFRLNTDLGEPYIYEQISGEFLSNIEVSR